MFEDRTLVCQDCGREFVFTAGEQEFYAEKGFENEPKRCKECRGARRSSSSSSRSSRAPREMYSAVCASCGADTKVPFKPVDGRPVYCMDCFQAQRRAAY
ncbi:CxxC-x17-CxxC domain-containing protein [Thermosyntropha lipolytica DSM 11003]|uniref:CxxC-x17-CxxC domain-containing protein n=1 Tax=Thermosyntropha lipolytica DSM 11003 TaxID=1123382 RepID=A0A1M5KMQ2_9FIRM|nr:zinc-ribbon domain containing protein [Thermosyntropha lipolytica]SHG53970.1 CxxC-x17-CxxC domain-containing protein [Thermosyntropha lipolytica DSM 11003]